MGFLSELLGKKELAPFIKYVQSTITQSYSLFESGGETKGQYDKRWKLVINMPIDEIIEIANS